jgi:membrane-associated phospholipid phosphatase
VADSLNPLLGFLAILIAIREWQGSSRRGSAFVTGTTLALAGIYVVRFLNIVFSVWRQWGGHYSTHSAFATCVVISLAFWCPRRRKALLAVLVAYLALVVVMAYHSVMDVLTSSVVACLITVPCQVIVRKVASPLGVKARNSRAAPGSPPA